MSTPPPPTHRRLFIAAHCANPSAELNGGVLQSSLHVPIEGVDSKDNFGNSSGASCPPPPLSKEARSRAREEKKEPAAISTTGSPSEPARRPEYGVAFPVAMHESDHPLPTGRTGGTTQQQSEFYFNLGRRMMLDSIE